MASRLQIKNMALAEIPAKSIQSENEASLEARETARFYQQCFDELLEVHDWSFATKREVLASVANARLGEWLYAYAVPADMATARRIIPNIPVTTTELIWPPLDMYPGTPFLIEDGVLFTNQETATLEYGRSGISEASLTAKMVRALSLELASRIAMPLGKSRELKGDLLQQAEVERQRAIADDMNRHPRRPSYYEPEAIIAREGGIVDYTPPRVVP